MGSVCSRRSSRDKGPGAGASSRQWLEGSDQEGSLGSMKVGKEARARSCRAWQVTGGAGLWPEASGKPLESLMQGVMRSDFCFLKDHCGDDLERELQQAGGEQEDQLEAAAPHLSG